ncbi:MAG: ATPase [Gammaproteobacteria bacterium RIFCSPLOWO2_02_FULL_38_11]|nr:MAG: ATPase [Gammaproteobacteria bacterium RIFCSPHIGHO2_12_38_15]OGT68241.1 MAG: ATPase [Gammaproteobacteria bacterium RIFCSPLOWO2_02_FULL_38_11]OGT76053.1 MAG: ATPase [Gammaproteobacteria bacterium RIFCSPLOWO2_12_FULL_38_14]
MKRYLNVDIKDALEKKIAVITGPRQCGKTTLARQLYKDFDYFNYDAVEDRLALKEKSWDRNKPLLILDELHKMKEWKRWLKGVYDKEGIHPKILVTGSAKLNTYKKVGDSLAGRYFQYRLYPLDLKEVAKFDVSMSAEEAFNRLWHCGGFPEPFLEGSESYYKRWRRSHLDIILRQDLIDIQVIRDIQAIETLVHLLKTRVGAGVSYSNLARDLERDVNTIKRWLILLENLYVIFRITPYHKNIARSLLKEPKYYFYDIAQVEGNEGARLENLVALSLLKELHFMEDTLGATTQLNYLRTKDGKEIDFIVSIENKPSYLVEVKLSDENPAPGFQYFLPIFPHVKAIQLVKNISREKTFPNGLEIRKLVPWLTKLDFS